MSSLENIISFAICLLVLVVCLQFLIAETWEARKFYGKGNENGSEQYWYENEIL
jgi:hypothetical protein